MEGQKTPYIVRTGKPDASLWEKVRAGVMMANQG